MKFKNKLLAAAVVLAFGVGTASAETLRLSHQWSNKDIRHKVAQMVADKLQLKLIWILKSLVQNLCLNPANNIARLAVVLLIWWCYLYHMLAGNNLHII